MALWWVFVHRGWDDSLPRAYRKLYCEACLVTEGKVFQPQAEITRDAPDAKQPP